MLAKPQILLLFLGLPLFAQTVVTVVNYAGYTGTFPVAPGSIASAYGDFGAIATTSANTVSPMPKELVGVRVRVNAVEAPLYFVSRNQINFVVPVGTATGRQAVEVVSGGSVVSRGTVNVYDFGPGLASSDTTPARQGIVQNQNFSVNSSSARASRGQVIQIYATGCGAVSPQVQDGVPPTVLSSSVAAVKAYISGQEAQVQFAGAHPQFPGICQINAVVPDRPFITGQVPLAVSVSGIESNAVSIWVQ